MYTNEEPQPLITQDTNYLQNRFNALLVEHGHSTQQLLPPLLPTSFKVLLSAVGSLAGIPYYEPATKFAGSNKNLGRLFGYSITTSLGVLSIWAILDYIRYIELVDKNQLECCSFNKLGFSMFSLSAGLISAFPGAYIAYSFNGDSLFYAILAFFLDTVINTCSINQHLRSARVTLKFRNEELLMRKKNRLIESLTHGVAARLKKSAIENSSDIFKLDAKEQEKLLISIIQDADETIRRKTESYSTFYGLRRSIIKYASILLPLSWGIIIGKLMYEAFLQHLVSIPYVVLPLALLTILPPYLLESSLGREVLLRIYDNMMYLFHGVYQYEPGEFYHPYLTYGFRIVGLFTASLCFAGRATVINQEIPSSPWNQIFLAVSIPATILFKTSAIQILIGKITNYLSYKFGDERKKEMSALYSTIIDFNVMISHATPEEVNDFIKKMETKLKELTSQSEEEILLPSRDEVSIESKDTSDEAPSESDNIKLVRNNENILWEHSNKNIPMDDIKSTSANNYFAFFKKINKSASDHSSIEVKNWWGWKGKCVIV